uniref:Zinc finger C3H1-type containing n=1 Tax=Pavo cristatus TaxID=9049 RepID=A0A8C9F742_PAVCR
TTTAALDSSGLSPKEEGELEDGEISDDDNNGSGPCGGGSEPGGGLAGNRPYSRRRPPPGLRGGISLSSSRRFPRSRHQPPPEMGHLHGHGGYRPKDSFRSHPPPLPAPRMPSGPHSETGPRLSFWERSHNALDRFRFRGRPYRGGWRWGRSRGGGERGGNPPGRPPGGGSSVGFSGSQGWREPSPRKSKTFGRSPSRKQNYSSKSENSVEESFEDLLLKYKQIQLELEYINKDERLALSSREENEQQDDSKTADTEDQITVENDSIKTDAIKEVSPEEKNPVMAFQAFELKPLRQKLPTPAERSRLKKVKEGTKQSSQKSEVTESTQGAEDKEQTSTRKPSSSDVTSEKKLLEEEEEMSELQLRLLALQSASKKWQQKEQQVMKESKEKLTKTKTVTQKVKATAKAHSTKKTSSTGKQTLRKQQTKTSKKVQQQKEQDRRQKEEEQRKQEEEEERRKREEEIRKIRDLSNQEEQYNRFMKLVGGKRRSRSRSSDTDLRWSLDKPSTDSAGGIYQYDNYDEVAMDTDSETNSPVSFRSLKPLFSFFFQPLPSLSQLYMEGISCVSLEPPPPLPPLPPEEPEQPPKPPFADEEEEEEMLLREELLKSLANKRAFRSEETSSNSGPPSPPVPDNLQSVPRSNLSAVSINTVSQPRVQNTKFVRVPRPPRAVITLPKHKSVVVTLNDSDDSESDGEPSNSTNSVFGGLESMIKEARRNVEASRIKAPPKSEKENDPMRTPEALPEDKKIEYRLLKEEIASREKQRLIKSDPLKNSSSPANSDGEVDGIGRIAVATKQVKLIALEKKRLQQLEYEYALKIQKLKEARALQTKEQSDIAPQAEEEAEFALPQPSLHDLTQDKLSLDSEENYFDDEVLSNSNRERRRSFRESSSYTKPNLKHMDTPKQEPINKLSKKAAEEPELFLGLNIDELKKLYAKADSLKELLVKSTAFVAPKEDLLCGQEISVDMDFVTSQNKQTEAKPFPFGPYRSPLLVFKSYRFSPYFRTKEKLYLSSVTYSNMIEPKQCFCRFDLTGTCNDDDCQWQHMKDCTLSRKQLFQDILSYNLELIGCSEKSSDEEISTATDAEVTIFCLTMATLRIFKSHPAEHKKRIPALDTVVTPDDIRYFTSETDDISNLETSVQENPCNVQLWIKLAYKYLNQNEGSSSECLDSTLNVLARALENNKENPEIWCHYLRLFSKRGTKEEIQEMCETAVEYAPSYQIWWTVSKKTSNVCISYCRNCNALKSTNEKMLSERLTLSDRCLAWLSYIHLIEFSILPIKFYDPANVCPSRIMNKEPFLIPWQTVQDVKTDPDTLLAMFEDAVKTCTDESLEAEKRIAVCFPLYRNMIALLKLLERWESAAELCRSLLELCPNNCLLLESLATLYLQMEQSESAYGVWIGAFEKNPQNAEIFYQLCKFLISQERSGSVLPLLQDFVAAFFENTYQQHDSMDLLRYLLNFPMPIEFTAPLYKEHLTDDIVNQQIPYLWQIYCLCQSLHASVSEALDAYEAALGAVMQQEIVQNIWLDYLVFMNNKVVGSSNKVQEFKVFTDLVNRCLVTVPTRYPIPFSAADYWTNYEFHNKVKTYAWVFLIRQKD